MLFNFVGMWFEHYAMLSNYVGTWWQLLSLKPSNWSIFVAKLIVLNIFYWDGSQTILWADNVWMDWPGLTMTGYLVHTLSNYAMSLLKAVNVEWINLSYALSNYAIIIIC